MAQRATDASARNEGSGRGPRFRGVLVFRWAALAWMAALAAWARDGYHRPWLAATAIGAAAAWTVFLTFAPRPRRSGRWALLIVDLAVCSALVVASGLAVPPGTVEVRAFLATAYPVSAALAWGAAAGTRGGLFAGGVLTLATLGSRITNGMDLGGLGRSGVLEILNSALTFLIAGGAMGYVSELLTRSGRALAEATDELVRERERAARLAERESLGRQIHDSVLQALALVNKRGRELAATGASPAELAELAGLAGEQEATLRRLIMRPPEEAPQARSSLRAALEALAIETRGVPVGVSSVGPIWLDGAVTRELTAAVAEALTNVVKHAGASRAFVFAEEDADAVLVSVRDDGRGFEFDAGKLQADQKFGVLRSMKGRIEELGGQMSVDSAPGRGTEVTFRVPRQAVAADAAEPV